MTALRSTNLTYGRLARGLHWTSAGLVLILIGLGLLMTRTNGGDNTTMYRVHVGLGLLVALLTIVRVVWRMVEPTPDPPPMARWRQRVFAANHYALYAGLFLLAASGIATLVANDMVPFPPAVIASEVEDVAAGDAHFLLAVIYVGLFLMHIAGVVSYQKTKGAVLHRMGITLPSDRG